MPDESGSGAAPPVKTAKQLEKEAKKAAEKAAKLEKFKAKQQQQQEKAAKAKDGEEAKPAKKEKVRKEEKVAAEYKSDTKPGQKKDTKVNFFCFDSRAYEARLSNLLDT